MLFRTGGKKGNKKNGAAPGYKLQKTKAKTIPPESEIKNFNPVGKNETKQKQNRKASETIIDTNGSERESEGQVETLYSL